MSGAEEESGSQISDPSCNGFQPATPGSDSREDQNVPRVSVELALGYTLQTLREHLETLEVELDNIGQTICIFASSWVADDLDIRLQEYQHILRELERGSGELLTKTVVLSSSILRIAGEVVDTQRLGLIKDPSAGNRVYIYQLIERYVTLEDMAARMLSRDVRYRDFWVDSVLEEYEAFDEDADNAWCPIIGAWIPRQAVTVAPIVRQNVPEWSAEHLFGETSDSASDYLASDGHIWSKANGIPLAKVYEKMLNNAEIAIVPTGNGLEMRVIVLDSVEAKRERQHSAYPMGKSLHRRKLTFLNNQRPGLHYLYFSFAINVLRNQRYQLPGWWMDRATYGRGWLMWADQSVYLNSCPMLRRLARHVGRICDQDHNSFWGPPIVNAGQGADTSGKVLSEGEEAAVYAIWNAYKDNQNVR